MLGSFKLFISHLMYFEWLALQQLILTLTPRLTLASLRFHLQRILLRLLMVIIDEQTFKSSTIILQMLVVALESIYR